ncbi:hypothetical protein SDC9_193432 [bioreactor metagenome]|uniref:Uncharacterized protein n=1 Tax=bioreactor metagenome TaxID=1076179 RepID=A0A645I3H9_9ZZZZ
MSETNARFRTADLRTGPQHLVAEAVAGLQQQDFVTRDFLRQDDLLPFPGVAARNNDLERFVVHRAGDNAGHLEWKRQDGNIDFVVAQHLGQAGGHVFLDGQRHLGGQAA